MIRPAGRSPNEIKRRLEQNWIRFLQANYASLSSKHLEGSSPPSVFVGRYGYPKVLVGPMLPPIHGDTTVFDKPESWLGKTIEEIASYRLSLVRGVLSMRVNASSKYVENLQELAMSESSADSEATFEKTPLPEIEKQNDIGLDIQYSPFGPVAPIKTFKTSSALSADQRIERVYYDTDLKAAEAVYRLYRAGVEVSSIHRVLSIGMLGLGKNRKMVPTRWSISATDDTISSKLIKNNEVNPTIDSVEVAQYTHLGNYYSVLLIPSNVCSFEMIESWYERNGKISIGSDHEDAKGLDHYPLIAGSYFAARLSVAEHLAGRGRKSAAIVFREIRPEYVLPVGVWQIREGLRESLRRSKSKFGDLAEAIRFVSSTTSMSPTELILRSKICQDIKRQTRMTDFMTK